METPDFLPLGSICIIKGNTKKLMIVSRGIALSQEVGMRYYDYGACLYPEGIMGDTIAYFNHEGIQKVVFEGFRDDDEVLMLDNLATSLKHVEMEKGDPAPLQAPVEQG